MDEVQNNQPAETFGAPEIEPAPPVTAEPMADEPAIAEPMAVEPDVTEPMAVEPVFTEPMAVEPVFTEPVPVEPVAAAEAFEPAEAPRVTPGDVSPSSLKDISDADLFGQHLVGASDTPGMFRALAEGDLVKGEIVRVDREGILVDVGQKSEGLIRPQEIGREDAAEGELKVGDTVDVMVMGGETADGQILLSKKRADFEKAWDHVIEAFQEERTLHAMVTDRVKGGLTVDLGIRGFIPASHVGNGKIRNLEQFIGQSLPLKVIEVDRERRKVVLSHRLATEGEREKQRETTLENLEEHQVRTGIVRRITDYGAFVDLGGVDGLLHISEMSWSRIKHPSEVVRQNQEIQVMVLKVSREQGRISLGMRQILPDPWTDAAQRYRSGEIVEGRISRLVQGGAFVQLEGGIEGFIKNSELAQRRVTRPEDVVKVGDALQVKVLDIKSDERRIELSRRAVEKKEEREHDDRGMREFRQRQQEDRFTLGDILGEALAAHRGEGEPEDADAEIEADVDVEGEVLAEVVAEAPEAVAEEPVVDQIADREPEPVEMEHPESTVVATVSPEEITPSEPIPAEEALVAEAPAAEGDAEPEAPAAEGDAEPEAPAAEGDAEPEAPAAEGDAEPEAPAAEGKATA